MLKRIYTWCIPAAALTFGVCAVILSIRVSLLKERLVLLERVVEVQDRWCEGLGEVNQVCEASFLEIAQRLGLDTQWMPLVNTALWKRAAETKSVAQARRELGAARWRQHPPLDSFVR